jgi:hypothetical protein
MTHSGAMFEAFTGTIMVQYKIRTTAATGNGFITLQAAGDFSPAGGPSIGSADLTYVCGGATIGNACSGVQTVKVGSQTSVVSLGAAICTGEGCPGSDPNSATMTFTLVDSPLFKTGSYSTTLTFSISAL